MANRESCINAVPRSPFMGGSLSRRSASSVERRAGKERAAVRQLDVGRTHRPCLGIAARIPDDADRILGRKVALAPAATVERVGAGKLHRPVFNLPALVLDVDIQPRV